MKPNQNFHCIRGVSLVRIIQQEGYGAFSYSKSHVNNVIEYVKDQEKHHKHQSFIEEYHQFLEKFEIDFDERYLFEPIEYKDLI